MGRRGIRGSRSSSFTTVLPRLGGGDGGSQTCGWVFSEGGGTPGSVHHARAGRRGRKAAAKESPSSERATSYWYAVYHAMTASSAKRSSIEPCPLLRGAPAAAARTPSSWLPHPPRPAPWRSLATYFRCCAICELTAAITRQPKGRLSRRWHITLELPVLLA